MKINKNIKILPVILCGGSGTRLWPLSRESFPKQFLNYRENHKNSFFQETYERILGLKNLAAPIIICNSQHRFIVAEQMRELNINEKNIILEPFSKNTGPALTLAALKALEIEDDPILLVLPADHFINENEKFIQSIQVGFKYANDGQIVTFGVEPSSPETGYGYIEIEKSQNESDDNAFSVKSFIEKPNKQIAKKLIEDGSYLWNSGIFLLRASTALNEIKKFVPEILASCKQSLNQIIYDLDFQRIHSESFELCPNISFDKAVMEKTKLAKVVKLKALWSDSGNWDTLWEVSKKDKNGNVISGEIILDNVNDSFFKSSNRLLVGFDVSDLVVVETFDAVLVSKKGSGQNIKNLVEVLKKNNFKAAINHKRQYRPWGSFESIDEGKGWQVKKINVKVGASLSLQKHKFRTEHWVVVSGNALVEVKDEKKILKKNESTFIPLDCKHRLSNFGAEELVIIEVQCGSYLGEDDIFRYEDNYGRKND